MKNNAAGRVVREAKRPLEIPTIDDKYRIDRAEEVVNQSNFWRRLCDLAKAPLSSIFRIRAIDKPTNGTAVKYRTMFLMNDNEMKGIDGNGVATTDAWGGWITTAGGLGSDKTEKYDTHEVAPPTAYIAQLGSVFWLTDDDKDYLTEDGDYYTYVNIRHDAHFHMDGDYDGRIYFTTTPPTDPVEGTPFIGEMVGDPDVANTDTTLLKESVNWRPQINIPDEWIPQEGYAIDNPVGGAPITVLVNGDFDGGTYFDAVHTLAGKVNEIINTLNAIQGA